VHISKINLETPEGDGMIERDEHITAVVFRKWNQKNGGIIALFPGIPSDVNRHRYYPPPSPTLLSSLAINGISS
jgi:hypothetical protein